jgi:Phosphotransferase system, mannose/fructose/N-acetylgalactosamine-specific component IIB
LKKGIDGMLNIVLARIDDRLIHGQVMTAWVKNIRAGRIIIVDDKASSDPFLGELIRMAAPSGITMELYGVNKGSQVLMSDGKPNENVILLVKYPGTILKLLENGVILKKLNIGGMGAAQGRKPLYKNISASQEERDCLKKIMGHNIYTYIQIIPDQKAVDLENLLKAHEGGVKKAT